MFEQRLDIIIFKTEAILEFKMSIGLYFHFKFPYAIYIALNLDRLLIFLVKISALVQNRS